MTQTINETITNTTITIEDQAGLDALPTGTELNLESDHLYIKKGSDGIYRWSRGSLDGAGRITAEQMLASSGWLPATVTNPEILGDFRKVNPFSKGDRVVKVTEDHFIAQGVESHNYGESEAKQGEVGVINVISDIWGKGRSVHVKWDNGASSYISPDNLSFVPQYGDKVRVLKADGCPVGKVGTFVPRHEANLAGWDGYDDHTQAVRTPSGWADGDFTYLVQLVEVVEQADLWDWERELIYPEAVEEPVVEVEKKTFKVGDTVVIEPTIGGPNFSERFRGFEAQVKRDSMEFDNKTFLSPLSPRPDGAGYCDFYWSTEDLHLVPEEPQPTYRAGDSVTINYEFDSETIKWSGPGVVTEDASGDGFVLVYSFARGLVGGFYAESIEEHHNSDDFTTEAFVVGGTVNDEAGLDLLPNNTVIVIEDSNGYIARTKVSGRWGWPSSYSTDLDSQDSMTRQQVASCGATVKHLGSEDIN